MRTRIAAGPLVLGAGRARWAVVAEAEAEDGRTARAAVQGEDVYATTAACAAHAGTLLAEGAGAGALAPAQAFAPEAFLDGRRAGPQRDLSTIWCMEGFGFFQDPDFQKRLQEMAEQMQTTQNLAWADNAIKLAVDMTVAAINRVEHPGHDRAAGSADPRGHGDGVPGGRHAGARGSAGALLASRPAAITSLNERKRKMKTIAANPHANVVTPIAICCPTE